VTTEGNPKVRNRRSWWSEPVSQEEAYKRVRGRTRWNAYRRRLAKARQREVLQLWWRWPGKPGVQTLIAQHLGVHKSTISRDMAALGLRAPRCPTCGRPRPRLMGEAD
jgi:hypothetical protein